MALPELPELLVPAGNLEKLSTALTYGADAVYLGGPGLNLRASPAHLAWEDFGRGLDLARAAGAKAYACLNALPRQADLGLAKDHLSRLAELAPDGLIIADLGVFELAREHAPQLPVHVSTQAGTMNAAAARMWQKLGASRVNLARELGCADLRGVLEEAPDMELEVFVHGAMCLAISGACQLSAWVNGRSGNRGECCHPCRFDYRPLEPVPPAIPLEESLRPGEVTWEIAQEGDFTRILAPEDLCLVKYIPWFCRLGVAALKIEGRMKSPLYVAQVTDVYATALRDFAAGTFRPGLYLRELAQSSTRAMGSGFFLPGGRRKTFLPGRPPLVAPLAAKVLEELGPDRYRVHVRGRFSADDALEVLAPGLERPALPASHGLEDDAGQALATLHPGTHAILRTESPHVRPGLFLRVSAPNE